MCNTMLCVQFWILLAAAYPVVTNDSVVVMTVRQGSSVTLDCRMQISAQNNIVILWRFQSSCGSKAYKALSNYSLVINNVNSSHSGTYVCRGTAMNYPINELLAYDKNFVTRETVTRLKVKQFREFPLNVLINVASSYCLLHHPTLKWGNSNLIIFSSSSQPGYT